MLAKGVFRFFAALRMTGWAALRAALDSRIHGNDEKR